jgi:putative oxidoreductase
MGSGQGPWATNGGSEYNVVLISALLALAEVGAGKFSLDRALGVERAGAAWMAAVLAAGVAGSWGAMAGAQTAGGGAAQPEA